MEKLIQAEAELFTNLVLKRNQAEAVLADESRLRSNVRVSCGYLNKLDSAATNYEQAVTDLITSKEMDINLKTVYTNKLNEQLKLTDPILSQLQTAVNFFNTFNKAARVFACMQMKICSMQKMVDAKIAVVQDAHEEEDTLSSLPKIRANLRLLDDVVSNTTKELNSIYKQIV